MWCMYENMLIQIDANDVMLKMQISHAATLWLLFLRHRQSLVSVLFDAGVFVFGCLSGVFVRNFHKASHTINILCPINLKVLAGFTV